MYTVLDQGCNLPSCERRIMCKAIPVCYRIPEGAQSGNPGAALLNATWCHRATAFREYCLHIIMRCGIYKMSVRYLAGIVMRASADSMLGSSDQRVPQTSLQAACGLVRARSGSPAVHINSAGPASYCVFAVRSCCPPTWDLPRLNRQREALLRLWAQNCLCRPPSVALPS